jgi:hypothetical protein
MDELAGQVRSGSGGTRADQSADQGGRPYAITYAIGGRSTGGASTLRHFGTRRRHSGANFAYTGAAFSCHLSYSPLILNGLQFGETIAYKRT